MSVSEPLAQLRHFLWKITHPREAREKKEEKEYIEESLQEILTLRKDQDKWLKLASDPNATADTLRQLVADELESWEEVETYNRRMRVVIHTWLPSLKGHPIYEDIVAWHERFQYAVMAHPNLPIELFGKELEVNWHTVAGFLHNPACPLFFLERPGLIEEVGTDDKYSYCKPKNNRFVYFALKNESIPPLVLSDALSLPDPWLKLEAQTHISAECSGRECDLDLERLEEQIVQILRGGSISQRSLIYELSTYGFLPKNIVPYIPWPHRDEPVRKSTSSHPVVEQFIGELEKLTPLTDWIDTITWDLERECRLRALVSEVLTDEQMHEKAIHLETALFHSKAPSWVGEQIGWGWRREHTSSILRVITMRQGKVHDYIKTKDRNLALHNAVESWSSPDQEGYGNPGIFYFLVRTVPDILKGADLNPKYWNAERRDRKAPGHLRNTSFLVRLAIALRLEEANPKHREWREMLSNDPNRYVRAAARREIAWPGSQ